MQMRTIRSLPFLLLALGAPAWAGQRATYLVEDEAPIVIDMADNGDARVGEPGDDSYGLLLKDGAYFVTRIDGAWQSIKFADFADALRAAGYSGVFDVVKSEGVQGPSADFRIEAAGAQSVAGREGKAFYAYGMPLMEPGQAQTIVVSDDSALAPIGRALEQYLIGLMVLGGDGAASSSAARASIAATRAIFALGTPLDVAGHMKLGTVESVDIPASAMKLPSQRVTRAEMLAGLKAMKAAEAAPAP
jgi:hypothetical protein